MFYALGEKEGMSVEVAMQWNDSYQESVQCFTNNIPSATAAPHLTALRQIDDAHHQPVYRSQRSGRKTKVDTSGDDMRRRYLRAVGEASPEQGTFRKPKQAGVDEIGPVVSGSDPARP